MLCVLVDYTSMYTFVAYHTISVCLERVLLYSVCGN